KLASDTAMPQAELQQQASEQECLRWSPGTLRNRERRAPAARTSSTWLCRNSGSTPLPPHRNGRHNSLRSPLTNRAAQKGTFQSEYPQVPAEFVGTVMVLWRRRIRVVGAALLLLGRILVVGCCLGSRSLVRLVMAFCNFV